MSPLRPGLPVSPAETGLSGAGLALSSGQFSLKAVQCLLSLRVSLSQSGASLGKAGSPPFPLPFREILILHLLYTRFLCVLTQLISTTPLSETLLSFLT